MRYFVGKIRFLLVLLCVWIPSVAFPFTVVIDAGHGGKDSGARGKFALEKNVNLGIALKLGEQIKKQCPDVTVLYTRTKDVYLTVAERPVFANEHKADLFISIHSNSSTSPTPSGTETFSLGVAKTQENLEVAMNENAVILLEDDYQQTYQGFDPKSVDSYIMFEFLQDSHAAQSIAVASEVQSALKAEGRKDRGVQQAGFWVLKNTAMPAVLVEVGFISNPEEEKYIASEKGQTALASAICKAFVNFKRDFDKKNAAATAPKSEASSGKSTAATSATSTAGKVVYKVQIATRKVLIKTTDPAFHNLKGISYYKENNLYKYTYGETTDYAEAKRLRREASAYFKDAFIVKFKDGKKIK